MLNYETLLSSYDDKLTLMQWLKKVEKALNNASATGFSVTKKGNATISFKVDFADGTSIESNNIVLQQGESVSGARMVNGHLFIDLTNGQTFDVGNLKPVTRFEIDASQHLIVYYGDGTNQDLGAIFSGNISINGNLNATGTINGTKVTGNEIVEAMSGYSYIQPTPLAGLTREIIYAGAVKNGNKITCAIAMNLTRTDTITDAVSLGVINMPQSVLDKLYPVRIGTTDLLSVTNLLLKSSFSGEGISVPAYVGKGSGGLFFGFTNVTAINTMTLNTKYYVRIEVTYLLSDNLASN